MGKEMTIIDITEEFLKNKDNLTLEVTLEKILQGKMNHSFMVRVEDDKLTICGAKIYEVDRILISGNNINDPKIEYESNSNLGTEYRDHQLLQAAAIAMQAVEAAQKE